MKNHARLLNRHAFVTTTLPVRQNIVGQNDAGLSQNIAPSSSQHKQIEIFVMLKTGRPAWFGYNKCIGRRTL